MKKTLSLFITGLAAIMLFSALDVKAAVYNVTPKPPKLTATLKPIVVKYKAKNYIGAMQDLEELVKVEKNNTYAKYYLALCYTRLGYKEEAKILYREVIDRDENLSLSHYSQRALDCLDNPDAQMCRTPAQIQAEQQENELPSDIDLFIMSGRKIHPNAQDRITKEKMERKLEEDEYIRRKIEEEKAKAGLQTSAIPTNEEIAAALNTLSKVGLNPYNNFNPLASAQQFNQFGMMNPMMMNNLSGNNMYNAFLNNTNPDIAQMFLYGQMAQQNNLMNYGI